MEQGLKSLGRGPPPVKSSDLRPRGGRPQGRGLKRAWRGQGAGAGGGEPHRAGQQEPLRTRSVGKLEEVFLTANPEIPAGDRQSPPGDSFPASGINHAALKRWHSKAGRGALEPGDPLPFPASHSSSL